jgi:putative two-component system response regulator
LFLNPIIAADAQAVPIMDAASRLRLGKHQCSVSALSKVLAAALGLDEAHCLLIGKAAALHDVGKLYVSALVNDKCGPHDLNEILAMHQHPIFGHAHLCAFKQTPMLKLAAIIALQHHEKFDGTGYPFGLSGDKIAPESRIVSICDVYDALREDRPYRTRIGHNAAMQVITCGDDRTKPSMFDPAVLNVMAKNHEQIRAVFDSHHPDI